MATTLLHFRSLRSGDTTWFHNLRLAQVTVRPGDWVRIDLDRHPELIPSLEAGAAVIESEVPPNTTVLDDESQPDHAANHPGITERRSRSSGIPAVLLLTHAEMDAVAHCLLPWDNWREDVKFEHIDARKDQRGAPRDTTIDPFFEKNFVVIHRLAELWARLEIEKAREEREKRVEARRAPGGSLSKAAIRQLIYDQIPLPPRDAIILGKLRDWGVWRKPCLPSVSTLRRYRTAFITGYPVRRYLDEQIVFLHNSPRQRIFLGLQYECKLGPYVPSKAASILTKIGTPVRPLVLDVLPTFREAPSSVRRKIELRVAFTPADMAKIRTVIRPKDSGSTRD